MRERHTAQSMNAYLDTPGGTALAALHGDRQGAAAALAEGEAADRAWRRQQAIARAERFPERYASVDDAQLDVPDPVGGGSWFTGSTDEWVSAVRWVSPAWRVRNLGYEDPDTDVQGATQGPGRDLQPADVRAPWNRD